MAQYNYLALLLLLTGCHTKPQNLEQVSRPPPFWPPHEHIGPGINVRFGEDPFNVNGTRLRFLNENNKNITVDNE